MSFEALIERVFSLKMPLKNTLFPSLNQTKKNLISASLFIVGLKLVLTLHLHICLIQISN